MARMVFCILFVFVLLLDQPQLTKWRGVMDASPSFYGDAGHSRQERERLPVYDIVYNMNMGTNHYLNPSFYYAQALPLKLMPPSREGYNFAGWYRDSRYRYPVTEITDCGDGNLILYAKWTKKISNSTNIQMYSYVSGSLTRAPEKKLSNMDYRIIENLDIPGMPSTRFEDFGNKKIYSADQCPQGLCITEEYILVTSYSTGDYSNFGCLHVFDRKSGEYLVTMSMKQGSHLGGITCDGKNLWVCHSDGSTIERIDYALVKGLAEKRPGRTVTVPQEYEEYSVSNSPSCITFFNGRLWVATHTKFFKSVMKSYRFKDGKLVEGQRFVIPDKVQGVAFDSQGHVYLSTSFGRDKSSYVKVYESAYALSKNPEKPAECVEMPPCSEELAIADEELFVLFESGAQKYMEGTDGRGRALAPIDHLVAIRLNSF